MADLKSITVITPGYPSKFFPAKGAFVENLVREWEKIQLAVNVIAPTALHRSMIERINQNNAIRPAYFSFGGNRRFNIDLLELSRRNFVNAAMLEIKRQPVPDAYYGKFLFPAGIVAQQAGDLYNRPAFVDMGESRFLETLSDAEKRAASNVLKKMDGIFCVSKRLQDEVLELGAKPDSVFLAPNGVDLDRFKPLNQESCRKRLDLPKEAFILAFTGYFIERKGPLRVLQALNLLNDENLYAVFLGQGAQTPQGKSVLRASPVSHDQLPLWLNASDAFVLPTLGEGHCNAINEAMACGLAIISSDIPDIRPQVPADAGILVDPMDIEALANAIKRLVEDARLRKSMGEAAYKHQFENSRVPRGISIYNRMLRITA